MFILISIKSQIVPILNRVHTGASYPGLTTAKESLERGNDILMSILNISNRRIRLVKKLPFYPAKSLKFTIFLSEALQNLGFNTVVIFVR